jgi:hypothetical protein
VALAEDAAYVRYRRQVLDFLYTRHSAPGALAA